MAGSLICIFYRSVGLTPGPIKQLGRSVLTGDLIEGDGIHAFQFHAINAHLHAERARVERRGEAV